MFSKYIITLLVSICLQSEIDAIDTYVVRLVSLLKMQQGIGWPHALHVAEGHEALLKLNSMLVNQQSCQVTTPKFVTFDVNRPPNNRYENWSDGCGLRVRNVTTEDYGRWRLTATRGNESITGWVELYVQDDINHYTASPITLQDGQMHTEVDLSTLNNSYCFVTQPFSESSLVPGHCRMTLDRTTRALQGNWHVLLGIPGRVSEIQVDKNVAVEAERLDVGYVRDTSTNKLNLYCNIVHTNKNITFCRFQKTTESAGYNIIDGLSDGVHSYYGDGFAKKHCGITIENPSENDYGTWRCTVGVQEWVGTHIHQKVPMQALIRVAAGDMSSIMKLDSQRDIDEENIIFVQKDMNFTIMCRADVSLTYCWFQHPNGTQYTPATQTDAEDQKFWYTGESLQTGDCGITFSHVTEDDAGEWTCHMGPRDQMGVEITDRVTVRVTGPLAARNKEVLATVGGNTTLFCHTANGNRPLDYCRFLKPNSVGINLDSSVTHENAILDRFYFTPGKDLHYGDCSLTINPVWEEDVGVWTCAALLDDESVEARDTITVYVELSPVPPFRAGIVGMSVGVAILLVALGGFLLYKRGILPWRNTNNTTRSGDISLQTHSASISNSGDRISTSSGSTDSSNDRERNPIP